MSRRSSKPGLVGYGATFGLLLVTILTTTAAQSSPSNGAQSPAGQDCTSDSSICRRGLLCLPRSDQYAGSGRICRQPKENEVCDAAAMCQDSGPNGTLACLPKGFLIPHTGEAINFPGKTCVRAVGRGRSCYSGIDCLPGLICGNTGLLAAVCVYSTPQATLGQDCSKADCEQDLLCKTNSNGSRRCVNLLPEGQPCNPRDYVLAGNPCAQSDSNHVVACVNGKCARGLRPGTSCTTPEEPSESIGQCDIIPGNMGNGHPKCIKSETGSLKCLRPLYGIGPCDSRKTGCVSTDTQCIKGYCGVPKGGQGDSCATGGACKPGLVCLKSPLSGAGLRCTLLQDAGYPCDSQEIFASCKDGSKCSSFNDFTVCLRGPVPIGGKCIDGETACATGLTCVPNGYPDLGFEGVCMKVAFSIGSACNPSKFQVCDRYYTFREPFPRTDGSIEPSLECRNGKCLNSTVGLWGDACGGNTGVQCAPQDPISKFQLGCVEKSCEYVNGSPGRPCSFNDALASSNYGCASGLYCSAVNHPRAKTDLPGSSSFTNVYKCVRYVLDGERCDYNSFIGCRNRKSSCVRGVCTSS
jgi:hypothetical protein